MALQEVLAAYTFDVQGTEKLEQADQTSTRLTRTLRGLGGVLAGIATVGAAKGLFDFVNGVADAADQTDKFATAIGASARDVAEWDMVLGNAGVPLERARLGLKTFAKQAGEAARGNKDLQGTLRKLGVDTRDASGALRPLNDRLTDAVLGLTKIEDPARRAASAEKLFGEAGLGFVRVALDGAGALEAQRREFDELHGGGAYEQFVKNSKDAAIANDRWRNATAALRVVVAGALVPALTAVVSAVTRVVLWVSKLVAGTKIVQVSLVTLGAVAAAFAIKLAVAFAPALATVGLFVGALAGAALIIEDIYQLFTGGESLIGRWIDSWLGAGEAELIVESIKEAVRDLAPVLEFVVDKIEYFVAAFAAMKLAQWAAGLRGIAKGFKDVAASANQAGSAASGVGGKLGKAIGGVAALTGGFAAGQAIGGSVVEARQSRFEAGKARQRAALSEAERAAEATQELIEAGLVSQAGVLDPSFERELRAAQAAGGELSPLQEAARTALAGFEEARAASGSSSAALKERITGGPERKFLVQSGLDRAFLAPVLEAAGLRAQAGGGVTINSPTSITVQGDANPEVTAQRVLEKVDQKQQDDLRRARESLGQR